MEETILASRDFPNGGVWVVDNRNYLAALLALAEKQPRELYLVARDDAAEGMPLVFFEEISRRAKNCSISIRLVDSFLKPCHTSTDRNRLDALLLNESFTIHRFYGYLAKEDIAKLQSKSDSIISLGLSIGNSTDAATINRLQGWNTLENFNVSVRVGMDVHDLRPLNKSFLNKEIYLTFPYLTDKWVDNVIPVIEVLMRDLTDKKIVALYFPKSRLTAAGAWRLGLRLKSLGARGVAIEQSDQCENWKPDKKEKNDINDMFKSTGSVTEGVKWSIDWLYKDSIVPRKQLEEPTGPETKKRKFSS